MVSHLTMSDLESLVTINRTFQKSLLTEGMLDAAESSAKYINVALEEMLTRRVDG